MATERLVIAVNERGARVVKRNLADVGKGAKQAEGGVKLLRRALGALVTVALVRSLINTADAFTNIQNRIRLVTTGTAELNAVTDKLLAISQRTRSDLIGNVELFNRLTLATKDLGTSQEEILQFTESLNQAIKISGASATEASAGIIQLSQGLASGTLRGDELRSVLEQLPAVADVISKSLGITRGELRIFGSEGKINAEIVLKAFREAREELAERFLRTVGTTAEEMIKLKNVVIVAFGRFVDAAGTTRALGSAINSVTNFVFDAIPAFLTFGRALSGTLNPSDEMTAGMQLFASAIIIVTGALVQLTNFILTSVKTAFASLGNLLGGLAAAVVLALKGEFELAGQTIADAFGDSRDIIITNVLDLREELISETTDSIEAIAQVWSTGARIIQDKISEAVAPKERKAGKAAKVDPAITKLIQSQQELLDELLLQETALVEAAATGEDYNIVLENMETNAIAAATGQKGLAFDIIETREELRRLREESANMEFIDSLQLQNDALQEAIKSGRDFNVIMDEFLLRQQFIGDAKGLQKALDLGEANALLREQLQDSQDAITDFLRRARENAQDILGGALKDAFSGGIEEIPAKFANVLADLAAQFFASEIFKALGNLGGGDGGGGFLSALGGFFGGNFQGGGQFQVPGSGGPDSVPTLMNLSPRETVTVTPPGQMPEGAAPIVNVPPAQVIVVDSDEKARALINGSEGEQATLTHIRNNPDTVRGISA